MARPKITRLVNSTPQVDYFKPRGLPLRGLDEVSLAVEELEAMRLVDVEGLSQTDAAEQMGVSRSTYARVLKAGRRKVTDALVNGKAMQIEGGVFELVHRRFNCGSCGKQWREGFGNGRPKACPGCGDQDFTRVDDDKSAQVGKIEHAGEGAPDVLD